jgi:hypothetical protein
MDWNSISTKDAVLLSLGAVGTWLGVLNVWKNHSRDQIRLEVTPKIYQDAAMGRLTMKKPDPRDPKPRLSGLCIEVANPSLTPIIVEQIGFLSNEKDTQLVITHPEFLDHGVLPRKLEPRTAFTAYIPSQSPELPVDMQGLPRAFVKTACGRTFTGTSPIFKSLIQRSQKLAFP